VRRALIFALLDAHIMRTVRDSRAPLRAQRAHNLRAFPPSALHPSALRLAPFAVSTEIAGGAAAMADAPDATETALECIAYHAPEQDMPEWCVRASSVLHTSRG
jgi:hypothetical protein